MKATAGEKPSGQPNASFWARAPPTSAYASRSLRPAEVAIMLAHRDAFSGRVLEVGCGAGRVTGYLPLIAAEAFGIDISPEMVDYCQQAYPEANFSLGDMRHVGELAQGPFDVVVATYNVIDALSASDRHRTLDGFRSALTPGGLLVMSTHNRAFAPRVLGPVGEVWSSLWRRDPRALAGALLNLPRKVRNHRRMGRLEEEGPEYALHNDRAHDYSLLHYYSSRESQERQLADHGFEVLQCLDLEGNLLPAGEPAAHCSELHYVSRCG